MFLAAHSSLSSMRALSGYSNRCTCGIVMLLMSYVLGEDSERLLQPLCDIVMFLMSSVLSEDSDRLLQPLCGIVMLLMSYVLSEDSERLLQPLCGIVMLLMSYVLSEDSERLLQPLHVRYCDVPHIFLSSVRTLSRCCGRGGARSAVLWAATTPALCRRWCCGCGGSDRSTTWPWTVPGTGTGTVSGTGTGCLTTTEPRSTKYTTRWAVHEESVRWTHWCRVGRYMYIWFMSLVSWLHETTYGERDSIPRRNSVWELRQLHTSHRAHQRTLSMYESGPTMSPSGLQAKGRESRLNFKSHVLVNAFPILTHSCPRQLPELLWSVLKRWYLHTPGDIALNSGRQMLPTGAA